MFRFFESLLDPYVDYPETNTPPRQVGPFLWGYLKTFRGVFALTTVMSIIVAMIEVALIAYMGHLVDILNETPAGDFWKAHGFELILAALLILFLRPLVQTIDVLLLNNTIVPNVTSLVRYRAHRQVLRQSVGWFESDFAGRIAGRIMQTPPSAGEMVFEIFDAMTFATAYLIGAMILMAGADLRLAIPMLAWSLGYALLVRWTIRRVGPASQASSDARSFVTGRVVDSYTNIHTVKMFAHDRHEMTYAQVAIEQARIAQQNEMRIYTLMDIALVILNGFLIVAVVGWAIALWVGGSASIGVIAAATAMTLRLNAMTGWIMWALSTFFQELGVVKEGMETITDPITLVDNKGAKPLKLQAGMIELRALSHHYGRETGGLDGVNLRINAGEKLAIVGRSGAGKSTLIKLLLRFYDCEQGKILIDGQDISQVAQNSLRRAIGMVQQENSLMHRSIRDNILYGRPNADEAAMIQAARQAQAHDFILALQDQEGRTGYDAHVGERGVKLSGGQRQRIALARVILKDAPILILDEATSALDSEVEAQIQTTMQGLMAGKTVIAIAHRLSTIAQMDRIVVLDQGRVVEQGTHQELLTANGQYAGFWARQSGGFLNTGDKNGT